ncbi:helix-turn-helix domain-containing protein [Rhizobium sp. LEGMi198b]|uniref:helix-turn-helix domain-containing protein n=1 Tax=unclassified Rhizobium TaxID=2613769 RepID=UPI000CDF34BA|nr:MULTISPECIES: XRE family transcriptional regulator [Rhizobium]AVA20522.1 transcriptional regulator protein [Rhizobium sp. NXC24]MDK4741975.1 XRE family transcriptional regulator [Rhizobium sp. CNPSo 3464]UWU21803.1 XRE family transcriptional regulator [Rhizobium tropici]
MALESVEPLHVVSRAETVDEISALTGQNLRRLRTRRGYSLDRLAKISGVSRAMLGQIETGKSSPTISILWKIAAALDVPCGFLIAEPHDTTSLQVLTHAKTKVLSASEGKFQTRALFPYESERKVEFYELRIAPYHTETAEAHHHGTIENLVVSRGTVEIVAGKHPPQLLGEGDAAIFDADVAHSYRNMTSSEAVLYLVTTYVEEVRG